MWKNLLEEQKAAGALPRNKDTRHSHWESWIHHVNAGAGKGHCRLLPQAFKLWDLGPPTRLSAPVLRHVSSRNLPGRDTAPPTHRTAAWKASQPTLTRNSVFFNNRDLKMYETQKKMVTPNNSISVLQSFHHINILCMCPSYIDVMVSINPIHRASSQYKVYIIYKNRKL